MDPGADTNLPSQRHRHSQTRCPLTRVEGIPERGPDRGLHHLRVPGKLLDPPPPLSAQHIHDPFGFWGRAELPF